MHDAFISFINDTLIDGRVRLVRLSPEEMEKVSAASQRFSLDFDDAYQYVVAEYNDLTIVSFDHDFDHTKRGRREPQSIA